MEARDSDTRRQKRGQRLGVALDRVLKANTMAAAANDSRQQAEDAADGAAGCGRREAGRGRNQRERTLTREEGWSSPGR